MDEKLKDTLRKILALTTSPVEGEAAAAAHQLNRLLQKHNLSIADLERKGKAAPGVREQGHDLGKAAFKWKLDLAEGIADFYYCAPLVDRKAKTVTFIGRPDNVEALTMLYAWVIDQIKQIATGERRKHFDTTGEHIDPLRWQLGFGEGAVQRLVVRLRELKARQAEDVSRNEDGDITALAVHHRSEVSDYTEAKFGYRTDGKKTKAEMDRDARWEKWREEQAKEEEAKILFRAQCEANGDMGPFYAVHPDEHPDAIKRREAANEKWHRQYEARERRNARRRTGSWPREKKVDWDKLDQSDVARASGKSNADRINIQPFITGATERKKVG